MSPVRWTPKPGDLIWYTPDRSDGRPGKQRWPGIVVELGCSLFRGPRARSEDGIRIDLLPHRRLKVRARVVDGETLSRRERPAVDDEDADLTNQE